MKILLSLVALCFAANLTFAQTAPRTTIPIFWQITKPGSRDTSYLLGTYHLASADRVAKLPRVMRAFRKSKIVVGEMLMDGASVTSVLPHVMATRPLRQLLSDSEYHFLDSAMQSAIGPEWQMAQALKPIAIYVMLSMQDAATEDTSSTMDFSSAMDLYFQTEGRAQHKKVFGLETAEEQAAILFDSIPEPRQAQGLLEYMHNRDTEDSSARQLEEDYYNGVVAEDLVLEGMEKTERGVLLDHRNARWLAVLPKYVKQHAFIAVGAGHLGGALGLVEGLKKMGYTLKPLGLH
jgi:uncharacterized protein YbaP (TraB family)